MTTDHDSRLEPDMLQNPQSLHGVPPHVLIRLLEQAHHARPDHQKPKIKPRSRQTPFCFQIKENHRP